MADRTKAFRQSLLKRWEANKQAASRISGGGDRLEKAKQMIGLVDQRRALMSGVLRNMQFAFGLEGWKDSPDLQELVRLQDQINRELGFIPDDRILRINAIRWLQYPGEYRGRGTPEQYFDETVIPWWRNVAYGRDLTNTVEGNLKAMFDLLADLPLGEAGEEVFQAGGFTVINKLLIQPWTALGKGKNFDYAQSANVSKHLARTLNTVASMIRSKGVGDLLYGQIEVLPMSKGKLRGKFRLGLEAVYRPGSDTISLYMLPIAYEGDHAALSIIHELGHRYYYKRMKQPQRLLWDDWSSRYKVPAVSERGGESPAEKFAEAFAWYVTGKKMSPDQREEFEAIMKKATDNKDLLATDPKTGETRTLEGWAKHFADLIRDAAREVRQIKQAAGESLDHGWSGHSTFAPMRHGEDDEIEAQPTGPASKYFFDSPVKRVIRDLKEKGKVPTPTEIKETNPLGKEYSTLSRFVVKHAARPIPLDSQMVDYIVRVMWKRLERELRQLPAEQPLGKHDNLAQLLDIPLTTVRGEKVKFDLLIGSKPSGAIESVVYGYRGRHRGTGKMVLGFLLNGKYKREMFFLEGPKKDFRRMLIHELTHARDYYTESYALGERGVGDTPESLQDYYNDPSEVRAYMQQIADEVMRRMDNPRVIKFWRGPKQALVKSLDSSPTWKRINPHLTDKNRNLILKALYTVAQDKGFMKAAADRPMLDRANRATRVTMAQTYAGWYAYVGDDPYDEKMVLTEGWADSRRLYFYLEGKGFKNIGREV